VHTTAQHTAIVDAILAGNPERARGAVTEHLEGTGALLRGFLAAPARPATAGHGQPLRSAARPAP